MNKHTSLAHPSNRKHLITLLVSLVIPAIILIIPTELIPITGLTVTQQRVLAIFFMAAFLWVLEPVPSFSTSLIVIFTELVFVSDYSLVWFRHSENIGQLLNYKEIFASFSAPIILLFIGGFALANAIQKYQIDFTLANALLKPFGKNPKFVLFGLMLITAIFSMFMSNTATTAMMLSVLLPVLNALPNKDKIKSAFAIGVPFAANIGGIGTPIGTPPNAIALRNLPEGYTITFSEWMGFSVPYMIVLLVLCWFILCIVYPTQTKEVKVNIVTNKIPQYKKTIVYMVFGITIILWMTDFIHGMNSYIVAMLPMVIFFVLGILKKEDLQNFNWDVLWLVSGGIAIGYGMRVTGLAQSIVNTFDFSTISLLALILITMSISYVLSNFMSHTAAANLFFPILIIVVFNNQTLIDNGLVFQIILCVVFASSLSMLLPISTPPNALGYSTGYISIKDMVLLGAVIGGIGMLLAYFYFKLLITMGFLV